MSALLLSFLGISMGIPHCPVWKEITPCTCRMNAKLISIHCNMMKSYDQVVTLLRERFSPEDRVSLQLTYSEMNDLEFRAFRELNMTIENLKLNNDHLRYLNESSFENLSNVVLLSLADNHLEHVPDNIWRQLVKVGTIDLGLNKIKALTSSNFKNVPVQCLVLAGNQISRIERGAFPPQIKRLHIGRNRLHTLNGTLTGLSELVWLLVNSNQLTSVEGELPIVANNLKIIHLSHNKLDRLPVQLRSFPSLHSLFSQNNRIKSLDGVLSSARNLIRLVLEHNHIEVLTPEDFKENDNLRSLILANNHITSLNSSLLNLKNLYFVNLTYNWLTEFAFEEVIGLPELRNIDLSYNRIRKLIGPGSNLVESNIKLTEIRLNNNELEYLNGALSGLSDLLRVDLSNNKLTSISADDLIGLDELRLLDISHNYLTTLEETSRTFLPRLEELKASHNYLTVLGKDFHGLPVLCHADLSNNQIVALGRDLVSKTRCRIGGGGNDGAWDTLRIYLQDNPILCDPALPEISAAMELNHTRIYGLSHCDLHADPPNVISQQPLDGLDMNNNNLPVEDDQQELSNQLPVQPTIVDLSKNDQYYSVDGASSDGRHGQGDAMIQTQPDTIITQQEKQITKLAFEIKELRSRVDELAEQSQMLLRQQQYPQINNSNNNHHQPHNNTVDSDKLSSGSVLKP